MRVSVIGGSTVDERTYELGVEVGRLLGERGHTVVCGGVGGIMEAACRGAAGAGGETIGILSGRDRRAANDWVTDSERKPRPLGRGSSDSTPPQTTCYDLSGCSTLSSPVLNSSMYASVRVWSVSSAHSFT